jgi:hypothetical protein
MGIILRRGDEELDLPVGSWEAAVLTAVQHGWEPVGVKAPLSVLQNPDGVSVPLWKEQTDGAYYPTHVHQRVSAEDARTMAEALERAERELSDPKQRLAMDTLRMMGLYDFLRAGEFETVPYDYDSPDRYREEVAQSTDRAERTAEETAQIERVRGMIRAAFSGIASTPRNPD